MFVDLYTTINTVDVDPRRKQMNRIIEVFFFNLKLNVTKYECD